MLKPLTLHPFLFIFVSFFTFKGTQNTFFEKTPPLLVNSEWKFIKETEGVKVYFRSSEGSDIKEVKMQTTFYSNLSTVVECLKDVNSYPKWVYKATYSTVLFKYDENDVVYYNYIDFPWPMQDRDIAIQSKISQDPHTKIVTSSSFAKWEATPFKKDVVRIQDFRSKWTLKPIENNKIEAEYVFRSNPGGSLPAWLVNLGLDEGPLKTIKGFKTLLQQERYKNAQNGILN
jgi:hypothetical protein